jgi:hypothetical protein
VKALSKGKNIDCLDKLLNRVNYTAFVVATAEAKKDRIKALTAPKPAAAETSS